MAAASAVGRMPTTPMTAKARAPTGSASVPALRPLSLDDVSAVHARSGGTTASMMMLADSARRQTARDKLATKLHLGTGRMGGSTGRQEL